MDNRQEQLRERAYGIWKAEGEPHGRDREHWEMAERELTEPAAETPATKPAATRRKKAAPVARVEATAAPEPKAKARKPRTTKPA